MGIHREVLWLVSPTGIPRIVGKQILYKDLYGAGYLIVFCQSFDLKTYALLSPHFFSYRLVDFLTDIFSGFDNIFFHDVMFEGCMLI